MDDLLNSMTIDKEKKKVEEINKEKQIIKERESVISHSATPIIPIIERENQNQNENEVKEKEKENEAQEKNISRKISMIEEDLETSLLNKSISDTKERLKQNSILCNTPLTKLLKANKASNH